MIKLFSVKVPVVLPSSACADVHAQHAEAICCTHLLTDGLVACRISKRRMQQQQRLEGPSSQQESCG
jgi:hypothetical protein